MQWLTSGESSPITSPLKIMGPCSAESEEQILEAAAMARDAGAHMFRAGVWKPRSRPNSFQGMGSYALPWLKRVQQEYHMPVCTEAANPHHVEMAIQSGLDAVWIGARTMTNPFAVQELAESLKGTKLGILIKNPINPDLELWCGGIERIIQHTASEKLLAIHRGFSVYRPRVYRNTPMWEIPIELRRRYPKLSVICDASHIAGEKKLIYQVVQTALNLDFDGFMLEIHPNPEKAKSDAQQQLNAEDLKTLLSKLVFRKPISEDPDFNANLEALRYDIDQLDREILSMISTRMDVVREIGKYKKANQVTVLQFERWKQMMESRSMSSEELLLSSEFIERFMQLIHKEAILHQNKIMNENGDQNS